MLRVKTQSCPELEWKGHEQEKEQEVKSSVCLAVAPGNSEWNFSPLPCAALLPLLLFPSPAQALACEVAAGGEQGRRQHQGPVGSVQGQGVFLVGTCPSHSYTQAKPSPRQQQLTATPILELSCGQGARPSLQIMNSFLRSLGHRSLELEEMLELFQLRVFKLPQAIGRLIHTEPSTQTQYIKQIKVELSSLAP